jgi:hypothetical protein
MKYHMKIMRVMVTLYQEHIDQGCLGGSLKCIHLYFIN